MLKWVGLSKHHPELMSSPEHMHHSPLHWFLCLMCRMSPAPAALTQAGKPLKFCSVGGKEAELEVDLAEAVPNQEPVGLVLELELLESQLVRNLKLVQIHKSTSRPASVVALVTRSWSQHLCFQVHILSL